MVDRSGLEASALAWGTALRYARHGWAVFPCAAAAKHPLTPHGLHDATTNPEVIARWRHRWPHANIAIRTGAASRLVVVDIDVDHGGRDSVTALETEHGPLPATAAVTTGAGTHLYYRHPGGTIPNSTGRLGPGLDIRGDGGYVIAPPSVHPNGHRYHWHHSRHLAPLPGWLVTALQPQPLPAPPAPPTIRTTSTADAWAQAALHGELQRIASAAEGQRNHTLNRAAFALGQIAGAGHLDPDHTRHLLVAAGLAAGLGDRETVRTVASGLTAGQAHPRHPPTNPFTRSTARTGREPISR